MTTLISYKKTKVSLIITLNIIEIIWKQAKLAFEKQFWAQLLKKKMAEP